MCVSLYAIVRQHHRSMQGPPNGACFKISDFLRAHTLDSTPKCILEPLPEGPKAHPEIHEVHLTADWDKGYYLEANPPSGSFTLRQGTRFVCSFSPSAPAHDVARLLSADAYYGRVAVSKDRAIRAGQQFERWVITFLDLRGTRDLVSVDTHQLEGGFVTIHRVQEGIPAPGPHSVPPAGILE